MCGICGYIHLGSAGRASESVIKSMMDTLRHRGPDDSGMYVKDSVALGHTRLSIIDLDAGHQPMASADGKIIAVYNGEIYNFREIKSALEEKGHRFKTHSDTEVIVHSYEEYGEGCLKYFNGMFAFAIWDSGKKELFMARDRFGKKPLYYASFDNQFIFASELKAILKHPSVRRRIDMKSLGKYLAYEYVPSPHSIFRDIYKLEAGCMLFVKNGTKSIARYWDPNFAHDRNFRLKDAEERLRGLMKESVRKRLISDVPLGVFLSGGIDSSIVVAMMAELMKPKDIKTFSVGFKEKGFDESSDARLVANHFGTDHHEEILDPRTMLDVFPDVIDILDEPFADSSIIPTYLVSKFTRKHVKVALGGDGGDELFMGYPSFYAHKAAMMLKKMPPMLDETFLRILMKALPVSRDSTSFNFKLRRFLRGMEFPESGRHQVWTGSFTPREERSLFLPKTEADFDISGIYDLTEKLFHNTKHLDPLDRAIYIYAKTYMTDDILVKVDRASMANSLEVRAPFLDTEFAAFALSIPPRFKLRNFTGKWILKDAFKSKLPAETLNKKKQGFAVPVARWLKNDLKHLLLEAFDKKKIEREGIFDYIYVKNMLDEFLADKNDTRKEIWCLFMFEMWYDKWM